MEEKTSIIQQGDSKILVSIFGTSYLAHVLKALIEKVGCWVRVRVRVSKLAPKPR